jgi:hypothetical protein
VGSDGFIDFEEADRIWQASMNPKQQMRGARHVADRAIPGGPQQSPGQVAISTMGMVQLKLALLDLERKGLELQVRKRELVKAADVKAFFGSTLVNARAKLLPIGSELRDKLARTKDPVKCQELVDARIHEALTALAEYRPDAT